MTMRNKLLLSMRTKKRFMIDRQQIRSLSVQHSPLLVDDTQAPPLLYEQSAFVYPHMITPDEETLILQDLQTRMKRYVHGETQIDGMLLLLFSGVVASDFYFLLTLFSCSSMLSLLPYYIIRRRFEKGHWDAVIRHYKEVELIEDDGSLSETTLDVLQRIRQHLAEQHFSIKTNTTPIWLPSHAIHLKQEGELHAHVDSVRFSGDIVAGLSLGSTSIMRLQPAAPEEIASRGGEESKENKYGDDDSTTTNRDHSLHGGQNSYVDLLLEPRSVYALTGNSRYLFSHELRPDKAVFLPTHTVVERQDRFSIIFRDAKRDNKP